MSIFKPFINIVKHAVDLVKGQGGNFTSFVTQLVMYIPEMMNSIGEIIKMKNTDGKLDDKEKAKLICETFEAFDEATGLDGLSFVSTTKLGKEIEESALDDFKQFGKKMAMLSHGIDPVIINDNL